MCVTNQNNIIYNVVVTGRDDIFFYSAPFSSLAQVGGKISASDPAWFLSIKRSKSLRSIQNKLIAHSRFPTISEWPSNLL